MITLYLWLNFFFVTYLLSRLSTRSLNTLYANPFFTLHKKINTCQASYSVLYLCFLIDWSSAKVVISWSTLLPSLLSDLVNLVPHQCQWDQANLQYPTVVCVCVCVCQSFVCERNKEEKKTHFIMQILSSDGNSE